jgi:hypothetical protein
MSDLKPPHDPIEALGQAYESLLETVTEDVKKIEDKSAPAMHDLILRAKDKLMAAEEISEEQGEKLVRYLERDLVDLGRSLAENGQELKDWLGFETALIEDRFVHMLKTAGDQTQLEWLKMKMQAAAERPVYKTGEVAAPGAFECLKCGERIHLHAPGHIPPCPKCAHTEFKRISYD